ncbi:uncharacterized protein LAJ45_01516 [Morchella importuna]|uniref:uncharacterized protein n=1 Tax=Morchella importuna TaxID=1174673 RepID=UPI001E8ECA13|nr:uncharacterized protein LAJ45_01516 [Morchella importuna]KAH8154983.1 hypothetical protein LAJ45_01516 [Morchella importuna]
MSLWNFTLLILGCCLLLFASDSQPRFLAGVLFFTATLGIALQEFDLSLTSRWIGTTLYIILNIVAAALSPLQYFLPRSKPRSKVNPGILVHHPDVEQKVDISVDIVAVHGLGSNPDWAWTHEETGAMWLKHFLPKACPRARIMAFNHNSAWDINAPVKSVDVCGQQLLDALNTSRAETDRPIIFIGHSFGGIIIKKVPVSPGGTCGTSYWLGSSTELLEALEPGAKSLRELNDSFLKGYGRYDLVGFFETFKSGIWGVPLLLAADKDACGFSGKPNIALDSDHIGMNKFRSETEHNYLLVLTEIKRMVEKVQQEQSKVLNYEQNKCLQTLFFHQLEDRREAIEQSDESTHQWISSDTTFQDWVDKKHQLIWISGKPGAGKSTLSKYLVDHVMQREGRYNKPGTAIATFFFNDRGSELEKSRRGFLQSLVYQILQQIPRLFKHIIPEYRSRNSETTSSKYPLSFLEKALLAMIGDPEAKSILFVIDALDECDKTEKEWLLKLIFKSLGEHPSQPHIFITSREDSTIQRYLKGYRYPTIKLDVVNKNDIQAYAGIELQCLFEDPDYQADDIKDLKETVIGRSQGVFLWVTLVIRELKEQMDDGGTVLELKETLDAIPNNLLGFYDRIFKKLDAETKGEAWRILVWVLFGERPLTVADFRYAVAVGSPTRNFDSLASMRGFIKTPTQMEKQVRKICGGLLEFKIRTGTPEDLDGSNKSIQLIHQSVKDFLLNKEVSATSSFWIVPSEAHNHLARVCLTYVTFPEIAEFPLSYPQLSRGEPNRPFLEYATIYWTHHVSLAVCETVGGRQMEKFKWPETNKFNTWRENLRLLTFGRMSFKTPLAVASETGLLDDFQHFLALETESDPDHQRQVLGEALIGASFGGQEKCVELLLTKGTDANFSTERRGGPLHAASGRGHEKILQMLLQGDIDVNLRGRKDETALQLAAERGHERIVKMLLDHGADVNIQGRRSNTALQAAAIEGHDRIVQLLIEHGADVNLEGGEFGSALQAAAARGHVKTVMLLLEGKADVNIRSENYKSALQAAAERGDGKVARLLLQKGADVNLDSFEHGSALQLAAAGGHENIVRLLLTKDVDIGLKGGKYGTALQAAAAGGHEKIALLLLAKGFDINLEDSNYGSALQLAAAQGHESVARLLLDKGFDVNIKGGDYGNALQAAAAGGYTNIVKMFLVNGAEVNLEGGDFGSALQAAAAEGHEEIVRMLLEHGADTDMEGGFFGSALQAAAAEGYEEIVRFLLEKDGNVNIVGGERYGSALHSAAERGHESIVFLLLKKNANVNLIGGEFGTPLQAAIMGGHEQIVYMLLREGADPNLQTEQQKYKSPLQAAAEKGHEFTVKMLLDNGADVNLEGGTYGNALQAAAERGNETIMRLLLEKGADVNLKGGTYGSSLQAAAISRNGLVIVQMLLAKGADVNTTGGTYGSALQAAVVRGNESVVRILLQNDADVNQKEGFYGSALHAAAIHDYTDIAQLIIDQGVDVNISNEEYGTPLQAAVERGNDKFVQLLVENGAQLLDGRN